MEDHPHVVHLVIALKPGGLEKLVVQWTNARNKAYPGSTTVCCLDERGQFAAVLEAAAVTCLNARRGRFPWDVRAVSSLRKLLMDTYRHDCVEPLFGHPVVVHSHNTAAQQYAGLACLGRRRVVHVHTQHGLDPSTLTLCDRVRGRLLAFLTDAIVAVSERTAESLARAFRVPANRIRAIPNGIPERLERRAEDVRSAMRVSLGIPAGAPVLGSVGRLASVKGYDRLLCAFAAFVTGTSMDAGIEDGCYCILVGDGPERGALEQQAYELEIADRVIFVGYQQDPSLHVAAMDLFVLPSRSEGTSVALLEAMSAGCSVLVTDVGDNRRIVEGGEAGLLLPADEERWPAALAGALSDEGTGAAQTRLTRARERVAECYSLESSLDAYENVYRCFRAGGQVRTDRWMPG